MARPRMASPEALAYLSSFKNYELKSYDNLASSLNLERVVHLLNYLKNPQEKIKCLHVAGTKGKGSVCAFTAYILRRAGYRVGFYTSPHLSDFKERIRILSPSLKNIKNPFCGKITPQDLNKCLSEIRDVIRRNKADTLLKDLTFFEITTVLALYYFAKKKVDFAVLETGLGGRLDATNVVASLVAVLTSISLDHTQCLGSHIKKIAQEKAAIIKSPLQKVVVAPQEKQTFGVIVKRCRDFSIKPVVVGRDIVYKEISQDLDGQVFYLKSVNATYKNLKTQLLGEHQLTNAATAVGMVELLGCVTPKAIEQGIADTRWPGRFEIARRGPWVVLDGAHNVSSCQALAATAQSIFPNKKIMVVLGISQDKDKKGICKIFDKIAGKIILTKSKNPRAYQFLPEESGKLFGRARATVCADVAAALAAALKEAKKDDVILVAGSLFVVGEARHLLCRKSI